MIKQESIAIPWKSLAVPYAGAFLGAASFTLLFSQLPFLLEVRDISDSPTFAGITTSIASAGMFVTAFSYAKVIRHMTGTALWVITFAMVAIGCGVLSISGNLVGVIAGVVIIGLGCGFVSPNSLNMVLARVAPEGRGRVAGIQTTFFFLGIFGGPMLGITLLRILGSVGAIFAAWAVLCVFASAAYYLVLREESARESHNAVSN